MSQWRDCVPLPPSAEAPSTQKVPKGKKDKEDLRYFFHRRSQCHYVTLVVVVVISCTERQDEMVNVVYCLIGRGGEFFEDTLGVVPVKHANRWEGQRGVVRGEGDLLTV
jgi:hypothetical protein